MDHWRDWTCAASICGWVKAEKRHTSRHLGLGQPMDHAVPFVQLVFGGESMSGYIFRRLLGMIPTLAIISVIVFVLIQLPPGDIVTANLASLQSQGMEVSEEQIQALRAQYNLDKSMPMQYFHWITNFVQGDMGYSVSFNQPVNSLIWERLGYTVLIALASLLFTWALAIPIGIYSAVRQYSFGDYAFTLIGLLGLATPNFMLALILMYLGYTWFGVSVGGLFSPEFAEAPWSSEKLVDLLKHIWIPMIVIGTAGTASIMRVMRANLLDELNKPYVVTARAKGVRPIKLVLKYPVRIAINPFISTIGWLLPTLISGEAIVSIVLNLPTTGPLLLQALLSQDMYLAGSFIMLLSILTVLGMLLSDILLAVLDPRIRFD
jgi:peptide/nickel transport system permease protein